MLNRYSNFVKPLSPNSRTKGVPFLSGEDAKKLYLEEIERPSQPVPSRQPIIKSKKQHMNRGKNLGDISNRHLYECVQNNDVKTLNSILDCCPNMLHITDEFGWSLLMIACQANSIEAAKELLKRGIDTSIRDKAGNSAQSLVIKNKNYVLADILISKSSETATVLRRKEDKVAETKSKGRYFCEICNKEFPDKQEHLSSTVHNISASKGKRIPAKYVIPASNKGYQILLKVGWDKESGLGPEGLGKKYPIKTVQKQDRKGLGLDRRKKKAQEESKETGNIHINKKLFNRECINNRNMEIHFRRQFY